MIEINGRQFCENCFETVTGSVCPACGYNSADNAPDPSMLVPGSVLMNRYVVGSVIGKGGFGITYLAYDALVCRKIAIKEYFPYGLAHRAGGSPRVSVTSDESAEAFKLGAEKFYNEAKLVARFNGNPNIVAVYDCFYENSTAYIAMEYLRGCTLKEHIREHGVLGAPQALFAARSIAGALVVAHSASVLHRDISPDNIILCDDGNIKLIDFGAARQVVAEYSQSFSVILKPGFAPPEQYRKKGNQGPWTDDYSVGTTLYFTLTGDIPEDPSARVDDDDTFKENRFEIDPALWEIITKATKLDVGSRYVDAYELKKALDSVPIKAEPIIVSDDSAPIADAPLAFVVNSADMTVSIKTMKPDQGFFRKHLRTILEAACVLAFVGVVIPLAVKVSTLSTVPDSTSVSDTDPHNNVRYIDDYKSKVYYSTLDVTGKKLYEEIYQGLANKDKDILLTVLTYKSSLVNYVYYRVHYDNPQFYYANNFGVRFQDENDNDKLDDDETIMTVTPIYFNQDTETVTANMNEVLNGLDKVDIIESLYKVHDTMVADVDALPRYANATSTNAYGAIVSRGADDMGIAKAFCYYAQLLDVPCYVVDGSLDGAPRAWCRVQLDGAWYNIDVYGDKTDTSSEIKDGESCPHTYFLTNDEDLKARGYSASEEYDFIWSGAYAANSPKIEL